jgi:oxidase EvaA
LPEQADFFLAKRNRNVVTLFDEAPPPIVPEFRWATLAELGRALARPDTVNMSLRSLLACLATLALEPDPATQTRAWLAELDASWSRRARERPLDRLPGWRLEPHGLVPDPPHASADLQVVYVDVHAPTREVPRWAQPMLTRSQLGLITLHVHRDRLLLEATLGPGQADGVRLGVAHVEAPSGRVRFDATLAEDGGRLLAIRNRYRVIEHQQVFDPPTHARWIAQHELPKLLTAGLLDIEARTCIAALLLLGSAPDQLPAPA